MVVAVCNDGGVYAFSDSGDGLWAALPAGREFQGIGAYAGLSDLLPYWLDGREEFRLDAQTGTRVAGPAPGLWRGRGGVRTGVLAMAGPNRGIVDRCGHSVHPVVGAAPNSEPTIVGNPDETIVVGAPLPDNTGVLTTLHGPDGALRAGPKKTGAVVAAGADGTFITVSCLNRATPRPKTPVEVIGLDGDLQVRWRVPLEPPPGTPIGFGHQCPGLGVVLDPDGMLYLAQASAGGVLLHAVQTDSPGLAETSWPVLFGDNEASNWWD